MDERALVRRLRSGSRLALEQAVRQFTPYVSAVVLRTLAGRAAREDVEELTADVFLALWAHAGELDPDREVRPWLSTVARNKALDWLRRSREEALPLEEVPSEEDLQAAAERREQSERLWRAVDGLGEPDRTLFVRYYYQGEKLKEAARGLGLSQTAAKQRLFRGRKILKEKLTEGGGQQ